MKVRTMLASLGVLAVGATLCLALPDTNVNLGIWKLNEGKSKFSPGATKNTTVVYTTAADGMMTVTVDGVDKDGEAGAQHVDRPVRRQGLPGHGRRMSIDSRSYTKVDGQHDGHDAQEDRQARGLGPDQRFQRRQVPHGDDKGADAGDDFAGRHGGLRQRVSRVYSVESRGGQCGRPFL